MKIFTVAQQLLITSMSTTVVHIISGWKKSIFDIDILYYFVIENTKDFTFLGGNRIYLFL